MLTSIYILLETPQVRNYVFQTAFNATPFSGGSMRDSLLELVPSWLSIAED